MNNDKIKSEATERKKSVRILALVGVVLLVALYASTLVFALMNSPHALNLLMASVFFTILVPVLIYAYQMIYRLTNKKNEQKQNLKEQTKDEKKGV